MSAGDREIILASEQVQRRNITAMLEHGNETRNLVRQQNERIEHLESQIRQQKTEFDDLRKMFSVIQAKLYQAGT